MAGDKKSAIAQWAAEMEDGISGPAREAAEALDKLRTEMQADQGEMAELKKAMARLKGGGAEVESQMKQLRERFEQKSKTLAQSQAQYIRMGGTFDRVKRSSSGFKDVLKELQKGMQQTPGPVGQLSGSLSGLMDKLSGARLLVVGLTVAFVAAVGAAAAFANKLYESALAAQDARRNELLHLEALTKMRNMWGIAAGKASEMQSAIDRVSASVSIARGDVAGLADEIYRSGARGKNFDTILEAASIKASALGKAAGSAFAGFAVSVGIAGGSVKRAAQDIKNRFGGVVQQQMKSLQVQTLKQKEAFDSLFSGINIEPLLTAKKRLADFFSQNEASGRALKQLMTLILQPLINMSETGLVAMRRFFKQMLIGGQEIVIAFLTVRLWFKRTFGGPETESIFGKFFAQLQWGRVFVYILAAAFGALAISVIAATWPFVLGAVAIWGFFEATQQLYDLWREIDWSDLGQAVLDGIVGGLKRGWTALKTTLVETAESMTDWFKSALEISSPSKVFATLGVAIPEGVQVGVKRGTPKAQQAVDNMVTPRLDIKPPVMPPPPAAAKAAAAGGGRSVSVSISELHVHAAQDTPKGFAESTRRELENILAGLAVQIGAPAP